MAIAVVKFKDLVAFTEELKFPKYTKVKLEPGGIGHQYYEHWIRSNVEWVSQLEFDPVEHVRITESACLVGEVPEEWGLRHQQYLEGTAESNSFKALDDETNYATHVNRNAIRLVVDHANIKYQVDFATDDNNAVLNNNLLAVAVFDNAADTSLSYSTGLVVDQIWTTRVTTLDNGKHLLQKRAYAHNPVIEDSYPWVDVGFLTDDEFDIWTQYNVVTPPTLEELGNMDIRDIDERSVTSNKPIPFKLTGN